MKTGIKQLALTACKTIGKHSPTILAGLAVAGVAATAILAARGHTKARDILRQKRLDRVNEAYDNIPENIRETHDDDKIDSWAEKAGEMLKLEKFKTTWLCYLPAALSAFLTIAAIIASNSINQKRLAAASILLSSAETALSKYDSKVTEMLGKGKADKIKSEIADGEIPPHIDESSIINTGHGDTLFYDKWAGRPFRSSMEFILQQQNNFNTDIMSDGGGEATLNDWYYLLDLGSADLGNFVGFTNDVPLKLEFHTKQLDNGQQVTLMSGQLHPMWEDRSRATLF